MVFSLIYVHFKEILHKLQASFSIYCQDPSNYCFIARASAAGFHLFCQNFRNCFFPIKLLIWSAKSNLCLLMLIHLQRKGIWMNIRKNVMIFPLQNINNSNIHLGKYTKILYTLWKWFSNFLEARHQTAASLLSFELVGPWWNQKTAFLRSPSMFLIVLVWGPPQNSLH